MSELDDEVVFEVVADALRACGRDPLRVPPETLAAMIREVRGVMSADAAGGARSADGWVGQDGPETEDFE